MFYLCVSLCRCEVSLNFCSHNSISLACLLINFQNIFMGQHKINGSDLAWVGVDIFRLREAIISCNLSFPRLYFKQARLQADKNQKVYFIATLRRMQRIAYALNLEKTDISKDDSLYSHGRSCSQKNSRGRTKR